MSEPAGMRVVFVSPSLSEASFVQSLICGSQIPCEMLGTQMASMTLMGGGQALAIRLVVPATFEADARTLIEDYERGGRAPIADYTEGTIACPACGEAMAGYYEKCSGCGVFVVPAPGKPPRGAAESMPDARAFCPACRIPSTLRQGACPECGAALASLAASDRVCPEELHVLPREQKETVCAPCGTAWLR